MTKYSTTFSVCMSVYKDDNYSFFHNAVESITSQQTIQPTEVIIVVDGPIGQDLTDVLRLYESNPLFKIIRLQNNKGHAVARQTALEAATNKLIAFMDADDISIPNRFALQLSAFKEHPEVSVIGGQIQEFIDNVDNVVGIRSVPTTDPEIQHYIKSRCPMNMMTVMMLKSHVQAVGGYIDWFCEEDYYLWLRMSQASYKFYNIQETLVNVRVGKDMYARRGGWRYFRSEAKLQYYMLKNNIITPFIYLYNLIVRFIVQVLMPNRLRGWVFQRFARDRKSD